MFTGPPSDQADLPAGRTQAPSLSSLRALDALMPRLCDLRCLPKAELGIPSLYLDTQNLCSSTSFIMLLCWSWLIALWCFSFYFKMLEGMVCTHSGYLVILRLMQIRAERQFHVKEELSFQSLSFLSLCPHSAIGSMIYASFLTCEMVTIKLPTS